MRPTEELMTEHRAIERMLRILGRIAGHLEAGRATDPADLEAIVQFIRVFADRCHHGKEEDLLFRAMEAAGVPRQGGPIGVMLAEHTLGREYVQGMADAIGPYAAGDTGAGARFAENARGYIALLSQHIAKEDQILYPLADRVLSEDTQAELSRGFARVEAERVGPGRHEAFHALLDRLEAAYA
ncbi:MAG: hemerythrin domain-containing protein [Chloroflexia bacterium]